MICAFGRLPTVPGKQRGWRLALRARRGDHGAHAAAMRDRTRLRPAQSSTWTSSLLPECVEIDIEFGVLRAANGAGRALPMQSGLDDPISPGRADATAHHAVAHADGLAISCVTRIAVLRSRRRMSATSSASARRVWESIAENGSSSRTISGSCTVCGERERAGAFRRKAGAVDAA